MKLSEKTQIKLGAIVTLIILVLSLIFSQTANPNNSLLFGLKRVQENIFLKIKFDPSDRVDYMSSLLDERLSELQAVFDHKSYRYILPSANRYFTLAGQITDLVLANNLTEKVQGLKQQFENHKKIINNIYIAYPKNVLENEEYKYIQDDYNYLNLYLDKLSKI